MFALDTVKCWILFAFCRWLVGAFSIPVDQINLQNCRDSLDKFQFLLYIRSKHFCYNSWSPFSDISMLTIITALSKMTQYYIFLSESNTFNNRSLPNFYSYRDIIVITISRYYETYILLWMRGNFLFTEIKDVTKWGQNRSNKRTDSGVSTFQIA